MDMYVCVPVQVPCKPILLSRTADMMKILGLHIDRS